MLGTTYKQALQYAHDCVVRANKQWKGVQKWTAVQQPKPPKERGGTLNC